MRKSEVAIIQKALIDFRNHPQILYNSKPLGISKMYGVCSNTEIFLKNVNGIRLEISVSKILSNFWQDWEHFSGHNDYPVPANRYLRKTSIVEALAKDEYSITRDMYDESTEYGKLRWELIDHLIYKMELYLTEK